MNLKKTLALGEELKTIELYLQNTKQILDAILLEECTADLNLNVVTPGTKRSPILDFNGSLLSEFSDQPPAPFPYSLYRSGERKSKAPEPSFKLNVHIKPDMLLAFLADFYRRLKERKLEIERAIKLESTTNETGTT